jgi:hypothetical protein
VDNPLVICKAYVHKMGSSIEPFEYRQLSNRREIRLLKLHPSLDHSSELHGEILHAQLSIHMESYESYEALSYTWGDNKQTNQLSIGDNKLAITSNLDSALRRLRLTHEPRVLWVDAICINQSNASEKNIQVPLMREIYEFASKTVVWLGEENDAQVAFDFIEELLEKLFEPSKKFDPWAAGHVSSGSDGFTALDEKPYGEPCWTWFLETIAYEHGIEDDPEAMAVALNYKRNWDAVANLFERPWWERTWVIQEVAHVGIVRAYIGSIDMSFDALIENYTRLDRLKKRQVVIQRINMKTRILQAHAALPLLRSMKQSLEECSLIADPSESDIKLESIMETQSVLKEVEAVIKQEREVDLLTERLKALKTERASIVAIHSLRRDAVIMGRNEIPKASLEILAVFRNASLERREKALKALEANDTNGLAPILRQYCRMLQEGRVDAADRQAQAAMESTAHFDFPVSLNGDRYTVPHSDLLENIWNFRDQGATDPRDKVYALLGMSKDYLDIDVDYSERLTSSEVFKATTRKFIEKSRNLDVLMGAGSRSDANMPSWVLDLSTPATYQTRVICSFRNRSYRKYFSATKGSSIFDYTQSLLRNEPSSHTTLPVKGKSIGIVIEVFSSGLHLEDNDNITLFKYTSPFIQASAENSASSTSTPFNSSWGPNDIQIGDEIVLLMGGSVPFVIREANDGREGFSFIGACLLIDSEIINRGSMLDTKENQGYVMPNSKKDEGYSDIMYGSAWGEEELDDELFDFLLL